MNRGASGLCAGNGTVSQVYTKEPKSAMISLYSLSLNKNSFPVYSQSVLSSFLHTNSHTHSFTLTMESRGVSELRQDHKNGGEPNSLPRPTLTKRIYHFLMPRTTSTRFHFLAARSVSASLQRSKSSLFPGTVQQTVSFN